VIDNVNTYTGHDEIHRWREAEASEYIYTVEVSPRQRPHHEPRDRSLTADFS
jgi:hypothetical protein